MTQTNTDDAVGRGRQGPGREPDGPRPARTAARRAAAAGLARLTLWAAVGAPVACTPVDAVTDDGRLRVVATTGMIGDLAGSIGGDRVLVRTLMGPGVDPHLYKARASDVRALAYAGLVLFNGLHLEAAMGEVLEKMDAWAPTVAVTERIGRGLLLELPGYPGNFDPHVWFDVSLWMLAAERVRDALIAVDPAGEAWYRSRADAVLDEMRALHGWVAARIGAIPPERRVLVTAHDAFGYFGRAYGIEVMGLQGISTASEAGTGDVQRLAEVIVSRGIPAIFVETSIPERTVQAVQAAVRARGGQVTIGGALYSDALGDPGTPEGTYAGMVKHNVNTIVRALAGQVAE
jgi:manganese/zinc/iron transport system substrate-binding protein